MIVSHNLLAMNANRMLGINTNSKAKSIEKLSSGYKINRAADDAAGLSISEKMRRQIRGLTQASANCQDGISLVQVADGALAETQDILQRMNELAVKAANGTNTEIDRSYIQDEVEHLKTEVDRIAKNTTFNGDVYPLTGGKEISDEAFYAHLNKTVSFYGGSVWGDNIAPENVPNIEKLFTANPHTGHKEVAMRSELDIENSRLKFYTLGGNLIYDAPCELYINTLENQKITPDTEASWWAVFAYSESANDYFKSGSKAEAVITFNEPVNARTAKKYFDNLEEWSNFCQLDDGRTYFEPVMSRILPFSIGEDGDSQLFVQAGSEAGQHIGISLVDATAKNLGVDSVNVSTIEGASAAIDSVKSALEKTSNFRSTFGAQQNRLEHTIKNLDNIVENTTSAESAIRDTDMAKEMVAFANHNVLEQAGQSMLSQANQSNQGVLSLLS